VKLVKITWLDPSHDDSDLPPAQAQNQEAIKMETYGLLLVDNETKLVIASTKTDSGLRHVLSIPKAFLAKIEEIS